MFIIEINIGSEFDEIKAVRSCSNENLHWNDSSVEKFWCCYNSFTGTAQINLCLRYSVNVMKYQTLCEVNTMFWWRSKQLQNVWSWHSSDWNLMLPALHLQGFMMQSTVWSKRSLEKEVNDASEFFRLWKEYYDNMFITGSEQSYYQK